MSALSVAPPGITKRGLQVAAAFFLLLVNTGAIVWLSYRIDMNEARSLAAENQKQTSGEHVVDPMRLRDPGISGSRPLQLPVARQIEEAAAKIALNRRQSAEMPPSQWSRELASLQAREPINAAAELQNKRWLDEATVALAASRKAAKPEALQTTCKGHRCTISAAFDDETSARNWSVQYLLAAGGTQLSNSKTAIIRSPDGSRTTVQLYLY